MLQKKIIAQKTISLLNFSKNIWIDNFIISRDLLVHPTKGFGQVAIGFDMIEQENKIIINKMNYPKIDNLSIFEYGDQLIKHTSDFSLKFLDILKNN